MATMLSMELPICQRKGWLLQFPLRYKYGPQPCIDVLCCKEKREPTARGWHRQYYLYPINNTQSWKQNPEVTYRTFSYSNTTLNSSSHSETRRQGDTVRFTADPQSPGTVELTDALRVCPPRRTKSSIILSPHLYLSHPLRGCWVPCNYSYRKPWGSTLLLSTRPEPSASTLNCEAFI